MAICTSMAAMGASMARAMVPIRPPRTILVLARAAEEQAEIGQGRDRAGDGGRHGHGQGVAVLHVGQLVGHHAADLVAVQQAQQARAGGDGRVGRVAAGGEGVGLLAVDHRDARTRQAGPAGQVLDVGDVLADHRHGVAGVDLDRAVHAQHDLVGVPVREQVHAHGEHQGDQHAGGAADHVAGPDEQRRQAGQQDEGLEVVHGSSLGSVLEDQSKMSNRSKRFFLP
jgi:hypothetical protein